MSQKTFTSGEESTSIKMTPIQMFFKISAKNKIMGQEIVKQIDISNKKGFWNDHVYCVDCEKVVSKCLLYQGTHMRCGKSNILTRSDALKL